MTSSISKEAAQSLKSVEEMAKKIEADYKKCEPHYRKVEADLQEAIDDKSEDELELFRPQMETALKDLDRCIHSIKGALALLGNLRKDQALMATKTDVINTLVKGLVNKQQVLVTHAATGRAMVLDKAQKALDEAKTSSETAESNLSELKNSLEGIKKAVDYIEGQAKTLDALTLKAQAAGDAKEMSDARVKFLDLGYTQQGIGATMLTVKVKKFLTTVKDSKQRAEAQWTLDDLPGLVERCGALTKRGQVLALLKITPKPATPAPKPAKLNSSQIMSIAKYFPIDVKDAKVMAKFSKVINDYPHVKWPEQLIKTLGWKKADVEAGMKKANQAPFVKPLYLIDI